MLTDNEIKRRGVKALLDNLGDVEAEKFIALMIKDPFDYTRWQMELWSDLNVNQVSDTAMKYRTSGRSRISPDETNKQE